MAHPRRLLTVFQSLCFPLPPSCSPCWCLSAFRTSPTASALQWLAPPQTAGGKEPYLFSQCQAIHARSVFPCQDSPECRITYTGTPVAPCAAKSLL